MICAFCSEELAERSETCPACEHPTLLDGRYRLDAIVGRGAMGVTYRAERLEDGREVAIKELPFRRIDAVKTKALFEREARVLEQLDHPGIPTYLDDFLGGAGKHLSLYLVQDFVEGETLATRMTQQRWREDEVLALMARVADILVYLHELSPPVIHRDIKPGNIMIRPDDRLALIDFGAVRDAIDDDQLGGSTVVGTYGFMAPEQFRGDATPATDLYAFGVTLVALLSRRKPDEMVDVGGRLDWAAHVTVHPATEALLRELLALDPAQRPQRTRDVAARCRDIARLVEADRMAPAVQPALNAAPMHVAPRPARNAAPRHVVERDAVAVDPRAPTRRGGSSAAIIGGAIAMVGLMGLIVAFIASSSSSSPKKVDRDRCGGSPCPPVAQGLKGLRFGMTRAEAAEVLPDIADAKQRTVSAPINAMALMNGDLSTSQVPGFRLDVQTQFGSMPATCELDFIDQERLSRMECTLAKQPSRETHIAAEQVLLAALTKRYGPPLNARLPDQNLPGLSGHDASWEWSDAEARLSLTSSFSDFSNLAVRMNLEPKSTLVLENSGKAHWDAMRAAERAADAQAAARRASQAEAAREAARKAQEALKNGKLGDDL